MKELAPKLSETGKTFIKALFHTFAQEAAIQEQAVNGSGRIIDLRDVPYYHRLKGPDKELLSSREIFDRGLAVSIKDDTAIARDATMCTIHVVVGEGKRGRIIVRPTVTFHQVTKNGIMTTDGRTQQGIYQCDDEREFNNNDGPKIYMLDEGECVRIHGDRMRGVGNMLFFADNEGRFVIESEKTPSIQRKNLTLIEYCMSSRVMRRTSSVSGGYITHWKDFKKSHLEKIALNNPDTAKAMEATMKKEISRQSAYISPYISSLSPYLQELDSPVEIIEKMHKHIQGVIDSNAEEMIDFVHSTISISQEKPLSEKKKEIEAYPGLSDAETMESTFSPRLILGQDAEFLATIAAWKGSDCVRSDGSFKLELPFKTHEAYLCGQAAKFLAEKMFFTELPLELYYVGEIKGKE